MTNLEATAPGLATRATSERRSRVHERYEWLHILNDFLLAAWFLAGSILFFYAALTTLGTWLFVAGSAQMMLGPLLRTAHKLHLRRIDGADRRRSEGGDIDF